jgi:uncharacterized membrane protein YozB (DUF420 family)
MSVHDLPAVNLPAVNATLNGASAVLLAAGFVCIKRKKVTAHRACMIAAFLTSTLFLICYLTYHYLGGFTKFQNPAWFRPYYLVLLATHTILAAVIVPLILATFSHALKGQLEQHKKVARWTWPLWMYVSVTGVAVYLILYQIFPQAAR